MNSLFKIACIAGLFQSTAIIAKPQLNQQNTEALYKVPNTSAHSIRVLLLGKKTGALVETTGSYRVYDPHTGKRLGSHIFGKNFRAHAHMDGIQWGEVYAGIYQITIVPDDKTTILVDGIQYKGNISIFTMNDKICVINEVDIEDYLKSVVSIEVENQLPTEVNRAITIAARTSAMYQIMSNPNSFWHVKAEKTGYEGYGATLRSREIEDAIDATYNLVLCCNAGENQQPKLDKSNLFIALWHPHCAGKTATYKTIFRQELGHMFDQGIDSPIAETDRNRTVWRIATKKDKLAKALEMERLTQIKVFTDKSSRKIYGIRFSSGSQTKDLNYFELKKLFGDKLRSNDFTLTFNDQEVNLVGYGEGHSVGICLYTAQKMATNGDDAAKILNFFFPNTTIISLEEQNL
jgi:stage II sporulation protein D